MRAGAVVVPSPPDLDGAVGLNHVVTATGIGFRVHDRTGSVVTNFSFERFWTQDDGVPFEPFTGYATDPRVAYDPYENRWIITAAYSPVTTNSALLVGVSATEDPTGPWYRHRIPADTNLQYYLDFPNTGFNKNWIAVHGNLISLTNSAPRIGKLFVFPKQNLYSNGPLALTEFVLSTNETTMVPATTYDPDLETLYLLDIPLKGIAPTVSTLSGPIGAEQVTLRIATAATPADVWSTFPFTLSGFAPQLGSTNKIFTLTDDLSHCIYRNGSLWFAHTIYLPALGPTHSAVQWWEIRPNADVVQRGRMQDPDGLVHYANASLAVNGLGDVLVGFSSFSSAKYAEAAYSFHSALDPPGLLRAPHRLKAGEGPFVRPDFFGSNRWGDHSATAIDPVDDMALWTLQEYASGPSNRWGTWWGKVVPPGMADVAVSLEVAPAGDVVAGAEVTYTLVASNAGPDVAENVTAYFELPPDAVLVSSTQTVGSSSFADGVLKTQLGTLGVGASAIITITAALHKTGTNVGTATVATSQTDLELGDNVRMVVNCIPLDELPDIWINEFHYDNEGLLDTNEGVEIAGVAGTSLQGFALLFYDGASGEVYRTLNLNGRIGDEWAGYGAIWFPVSPMQNGQDIPPYGRGDAIALAAPCSGIMQFISYEGEVTAVNGAAAGMVSTDIGVYEPSDTPSGYSLQLAGTGSTPGEFTWIGPVEASPGHLNADQTVLPAVDPNPDSLDIEFFVADPHPRAAVYSLTNRLYSLDGAAELTGAPTWSPRVVDVPGNGGVLWLIDTNGVDSLRFYRARSRLP